MKYALTASGEKVLAAADAPAEGVCSSRGEAVTLRQRQGMHGQTVSYDWRHRQAPPHCPHKSRPTVTSSSRL